MTSYLELKVSCDQECVMAQDFPMAKYAKYLAERASPAWLMWLDHMAGWVEVVGTCRSRASDHSTGVQGVVSEGTEVLECL